MSTRAVQVAAAALALIGYGTLPAQAEFGAVVVIADEGLAIAVEIGSRLVPHHREPCRAVPDHSWRGEGCHPRPGMRPGGGHRGWLRSTVNHAPARDQRGREGRTEKPAWAGRGYGSWGTERITHERDRGNGGWGGRERVVKTPDRGKDSRRAGATPSHGGTAKDRRKHDRKGW